MKVWEKSKLLDIFWESIVDLLIVPPENACGVDAGLPIQRSIYLIPGTCKKQHINTCITTRGHDLAMVKVSISSRDHKCSEWIQLTDRALSLQKWHVIFFPQEILIIFAVFSKMCVSTHEYHHSTWGKDLISLMGITEKSCYYPPPANLVGFRRWWKTAATTPPPHPPNRVGFWRSRKRLNKFNKLNLAALLVVLTCKTTTSLVRVTHRIVHVGLLINQGLPCPLHITSVARIVVWEGHPAAADATQPCISRAHVWSYRGRLGICERSSSQQSLGRSSRAKYK